MVLVGDVDDLDEAVVVRAVDPEAADLDARVRGGRSVLLHDALLRVERAGGAPLAGRPAVAPGCATRRPARVGSVGLAVGLAGVEELDAVGDDLELLAAAVLAVPLVVVQATLDGDPAALGEVVGADLGLAAEADDVDEVRAAVLAVLVAAARDGEAQLGDLASRRARAGRRPG